MSADSDILVSICCIVYNQGRFVGQTLEGFVSQKTNFRYEVLINDDCSTDNSADVIKEYAAKYPDIIKPIYHTENQYSKGISVGYANNFNRVRGKYIAMCEGDDYWIDSGKLQMQVDFLESHPEYSLTYTDYKYYVQEEGRFYANTYDRQNFENPTFRQHLIHTMYLAPCTWMFRAKDLPALKKHYDDETYRMMLYFMSEHKIKYIDKVTAVYRILKQSASHTVGLSKKYNFLKGLIDTQNECMELYSANKELVTEVHYHMYNRIFKLALAVGDYQYIGLMRKFWECNKCRNISDRIYYICSHFPHVLHSVFHLLYSVKYFFKRIFGIQR